MLRNKYINKLYRLIDEFIANDRDFMAVILVFYCLGIISPILILHLKNMNISDLIKYTDQSNIGQIGDFIAGTTMPWFTIVTLVLLVRTYYLQKEEKNIARRQSDLDIFFYLLNRWVEVREKTIVDIPEWVCSNIVNLNIIPQRFFDGVNTRFKVYEFFQILGMLFRGSSFRILWANLDIIRNDNDDLKKITTEVLQYTAINYFTQLYLVLMYIDGLNDNENLKKFMLYNLKMTFHTEERYIFSLIVDIIDVNILGEDDAQFKILLRKYGKQLFFC